jgi:8-oxo-dGTP pyrophosphatase MutT (NUDIX family)
MPQLYANGLQISTAQVLVPVFNGWTREALASNRYFDWAADCGYDLAAKLVGDQRFVQYAAGFDPEMIVDHFVIMSMFTAPNKARTILFAELYIYLKGNPNPQFVLWSGNTVSVPVIFIDENGKRHALLTEQARPPIGQMHSFMFPAGIIEPSGSVTLRVSQSFNTAADELLQETGINLREYKPEYLDTLVLSQGRISELTDVYLLQIPMLLKNIDLFQDMLTGLRKQEGEEITLHVIDLEDLDVYSPGTPTSILVKAVLGNQWRRQRQNRKNARVPRYVRKP